MPVTFKKIGWKPTSEGWVYEVRAVSETDRIVAKSTATLSRDDAQNIEDYLGQAAVKDIEKTAEEMCQRLVPASEH